MRSTQTGRPRARGQLIRTWLQEASREDLLYAWAEGAYTWRELGPRRPRDGRADVTTLRRHQHAHSVMTGRNRRAGRDARSAGARPRPVP